LLVQLDDRLAKSKLDGARAVEQRAAADLDKLRNGPREEELEAARQTALQLSAGVQSLRAKVDALQPLHEKGDISDVEFGQAQARLRAAEAESGAAEAGVKLLEAGSRPEDITAAEAALASASADVAAAELAVEYCRVTAPISGVVTGLSTNLGASVSPTDMIATIIDTSELFVRVRIPSAQLRSVKSGAPTDVWVGSESDTVSGSVSRLSPLADPSSGDLDAFVSAPNKSGALRPGVSCRTRVWLPELADALVVPVAAVADRAGQAVVTLIRNDEAYETPVRLGVSTRDYVQVLDGLSDGDIIAVEGGYGLPDGCPVQVTQGAGG
jgi:multidrug efflux pump subunit AcrA (membrane-fusion protein)